MSKKKKVFLATLLVLIIALVFVLPACSLHVKHKVIFSVDGATYYTIDTNGEEQISLPANPVKEDYIFDGWYWDDGIWAKPFTASSLLDQPLKDNMTVYAKWIEEDATKRTYDVTFNTFGGSAVGSQKIKYGNPLPKDVVSTKKGYVFTGWYKDAEGTIKWDYAVDRITENTVLYAKWVDESDASGCEIISTNGIELSGNELYVKVSNNTEYFALSDAITVSPYASWTVTTDIAGKNEIPSATVSLSVGDNTYYVNVVSGTKSNKKQYTVKIRRRPTYVVTYMPENGLDSIQETLEEDSTISALDISKKGYTFQGWTNNGKAWADDTPIVDNTTLVASWKANSYTVTFDCAGGEALENATLTYYSDYKLTPTTRKGYTFVGWLLDNELITNSAGDCLNVFDVDSDVTMIASWEIVTYIINYHNTKEAENLNPTTFTIEDEIELQSISKAGYTFEGWSDSDNQALTKIECGTSQDMNLYASWELISYTATFKVLDEVVAELSFTVETLQLEEPSIQEKIGYNSAWSEYEFVASNITINAVYIPIVYTITYENGGEHSNPTEYTIESEKIVLADSNKPGYTFIGWTMNDEEISEIPQGTIGNLTIKANWEAIEYNLTFVLDSPDGTTKGYYNENESNPSKYTLDDDITFVTLNCGIYGYTFKGWYDSKVEGNKVVGINANFGVGDRILYAQWVLEEYEIIYHNVLADGNTNQTTYTIESETFTLRDPNKTAYSFTGWTVYDALTDSYIPAETTITMGSHGKKEFYANWTPVVYTLSWELNGGTYVDADNPDTYTVETGTIELQPLEKKGYNFVGWFDAPTEGREIERIETGSYGDCTLYARFQVIRYEITYCYMYNGVIGEVAQNSNPTTYTVEDDAIVLLSPFADSYSFIAWYLEESLENQVISIDTANAENITIYAKFVNFSITYIGLSESDVNNNPMTYDLSFDTIVLLDASREGWSFIGWFDSESDGNKIEEIITSSMTAYTLYARFEINQYTISFNSNGGTELDSLTQDFASVIAVPTAPFRTGYKFLGWFEDDAESAFEFSTMPSRNVELSAHWELITYMVEYTLNGADKGGNVDTYTIEDLPISLNNPTKTGWTFGGWFIDSGMDEENRVTAITTIPDYGTITYLYAKLTINQYTFTFDSNGGSNVESITQNFDTSIEAPPAPTKLGYEFVGWKLDNELYTFTTVPAHDVNLIADWKTLEYPINYSLNGGENGDNPTTYTIESESIILKDASKLGYNFVGWFDSNEDGNKVESIELGSYGEITLYARFETIVYTITYENIENASHSNPTTYTIETQTFQLTSSKKVGYSFVGWFDANDKQIGQILNGSCGNMVLTAKWIEREYNVYLNRDKGAAVEVSFDLNGANGTAPDTQLLSDDTALKYPNIPVREGYIFGGWYNNADCEGELYNFTNLVSESLTLYARWIPVSDAKACIAGVDYNIFGGITNNSTVSVNVNGKDYRVYLYMPLASGNVSIYTEGDLDTFGYLFNKDGNRLASNDDGEDNADKNFIINYNVTAGVIYYVVVRGYSPNIQGVSTLKINGTTKPNDGGVLAVSYDKQTLKFGQSFVLPIVEGNDKYSFKGWFTGTDGTGEQITGADGVSLNPWAIDDNVTLYSYLQKRTYAVTFDCLGYADDLQTIYVSYGDRLDLNLYKPQADGYSFKGWMLDYEFYEATTMPDYALNLVANWEYYFLSDEIKVDENKKAVSIHDTIDADLFSIVVFDSDGNEVSGVTATITGSFTAGSTITISFNLEVEKYGEIYQATKTISGVKVYGDPTLNYNSSVEYVNINDGLTASWFSASGVDTFGDATQIKVTGLQDLVAGTLVTIMIESIDPGGNVTFETIENVKVYDVPVITYNNEKFEISINDTLTPELFGATAVDSFGNALTVSVVRHSDTIEVGKTVTIRISSTDNQLKSNTKVIDISCNVYGTPTINTPNNVDFRYDGEVTVEGLGLTATDTFNNPLAITLTTNDTWATGKLTYVASVTDIAGNTQTRWVEVNIYGTPVITYDKTALTKEECESISNLITSFTVTFNLNGANGLDYSQVVDEDNTLNYPAIPTREGYIFAGWYENVECTGVAYDFAADLTHDISVYAKWIESSTKNVIIANQDMSVSVVSKSNSTASNNFAFVPLVDGQIEIYTTGSLDTYGYLYDADGKQLTNDDDSGSGSNFKIAYNVTAGVLYYIRPCGYRSSGTTTLRVSCGVPNDGGKIIPYKPNPLNVLVNDSIGDKLNMTIELKQGEIVGGTYVIYTITATDKLGNTASLDTALIPVYDVQAIIDSATYTVGTSQISVDENGSTFRASATDSFGNACKIKVLRTNGYDLWAGDVQDVVIVFSDPAGNTHTTDPIKNKSVYGVPTVEYRDHAPIIINGERITYYIKEGETVADIRAYFYSTDSFGKELSETITADSIPNAGGTFSLTLTVRDVVRNVFEQTYTFYVICENHTLDSNCVCTVCGTTHILDSNCICTVCGTTYHIYKDGYCEQCGEQAYTRNGNTIYFGSYPQTKVTDNGIINALGGFDKNTWTSYGYYISGSVQNYMYYIDKEYNGSKYRGVYFTSYRPYCTTFSSGSSNSHQDDNGYKTSTVYWFKYEPIKWDIVQESGGYATIVANLILDSQEYYISDTSNKTTRTDYQGNTDSAYSNNYQYSTIRSWLNTTFYETAFTELQKQIIQTVTVDNSGYSTGDSSNSYTCADTKDKVWLLSYKELTTYFTSYSARQKQGTDYAKCQGLWVSTLSGDKGNSPWWLRSPDDISSYSSRVVDYDGYVYNFYVYDAYRGVVPALKILL